MKLLVSSILMAFACSGPASADCDNWSGEPYWQEGLSNSIRTCMSSSNSHLLSTPERESPIQIAARYADAATIEFMIDSGHPLEGTPSSPLLCEAIRNGNLEGFYELLSSGAKVEGAGGMRPIICAINAGEEGTQILAALIEAGASPDALEGGQPPIATAVVNNPMHVELLLRKGADPNARSPGEYAETLLMSAAVISWQSGPNPVRELLNAGAQTAARDSFGNSALHYAAAQGTAEVIEILLDAGAEPTVRNTSGDTALHLAAAHNSDPSVVEIMLDLGADAGLVNAEGNTPFDLATDNEALQGTSVLLRLSDARFE